MSLNCKHLFIMISVGQEFRSHLARCSDSGSLEVIIEILARIAVMQSSKGFPGLQSLLGHWLTHMPDKLVLAVGRIPMVLSKWDFPWATWMSFQHGGRLPLERELRETMIKVTVFFLSPSLKSHTLSFLPYHCLPRSALFSVGGNYKKAWRLKGKNYLRPSWRLDASEVTSDPIDSLLANQLTPEIPAYIISALLKFYLVWTCKGLAAGSLIWALVHTVSYIL